MWFIEIIKLSGESEYKGCNLQGLFCMACTEIMLSYVELEDTPNHMLDTCFVIDYIKIGVVIQGQ